MAKPRMSDDAPAAKNERKTHVRIVTQKQLEEISQFFEETQATARKSFERDGVCVPVAIFRCDGQNIVLPLHRIINHKEAAAKVLNKLIKELRPLAFIFVTEAWMARAKTDPASVTAGRDDLERTYGGSLTATAPDGSHRPKEGVTEAVMLQCCAVTGENFTVTADIVRNGAKPVLKPWERMENRGSVGRFIFDVVPLTERQ